MEKSITLIKPEVEFPVKKQGFAGDLGIPLGLLYIGGYVRDNNDYNVNIVDHRLDRVLGRNVDYDNSFGNSQIVGVGAVTAEAPATMKLFRKAKEQGRTTVAGGIYSTFNAESMLRSGNVDYVITGEGEKGISGLLDALDGKQDLQSVKGLVYLEDNQVVNTGPADMIRDLDSLGMPAYDLIDAEAYAQFSPASIYATRGCPLTCKFCTLNEMWAFRQRRRSIDNIVEELSFLKDAGFDRVHFKDETITLAQKWAQKLFTEIGNANLGQEYKAKSRIEGITPEVMKPLMDAGLDTIHTGVESVSQTSLDGMKKRTNTNAIVEKFDLASSMGFNLNPVYLFSYTGETPEDLRINAEFIERMGSRDNVISYVSFITPHPGSSFAQEMEPELTILSRNLSRYTHKQPVAVPKSLGEDGFELMIQYYNQIAENTGMRHVNPEVDPSYIDEVRKALSQRGRKEVLAA